MSPAASLPVSITVESSRPGTPPGSSRTDMTAPFEDGFEELFRSSFPRLYRYLDRLSGDPELAADLAQEAFVRLYRRGVLPESPMPWLVTVALNLFRNARTTSARRRALMTSARAEASMADPAPPPDHLSGMPGADRVRAALDSIPEREQQLLLLRAEGLSYREMAAALALNEHSIGTLLARAKRAFLEAYDGERHAS